MDANKTPIKDLVSDALEHYEEAAAEIHHWNSLIPKALKFYEERHCDPREGAYRWRSVEEERPEYKKEVLVCRPNKHSGNVDLLIARLHPKKEEGQKYGRADEWDKITYDDYWSFPGISPLEACTHWMPLPEPPTP